MEKYPLYMFADQDLMDEKKEEILEILSSTNQRLPPPDYPRFFEVIVMVLNHLISENALPEGLSVDGAHEYLDFFIQKNIYDKKEEISYFVRYYEPNATNVTELATPQVIERLNKIITQIESSLSVQGVHHDEWPDDEDIMQANEYIDELNVLMSQLKENKKKVNRRVAQSVSLLGKEKKLPNQVDRVIQEYAIYPKKEIGGKKFRTKRHRKTKTKTKTKTRTRRHRKTNY